MKRTLATSALGLLSLSTIVLCANQVLSHPGRTNAQGCHTNRQTGEYHCHNSGTNTPSNPPSSNPQQATVDRIIDGDTLDVRFGSKKQTLRLTCIDTPERGDGSFYEDAKNRLAQLAPLNQIISVRFADQGTDSHGRLVTEIYRNNQSINLQLVREGKAMIYCQYFYNCSGSRQSYLSAEEAAQSEGLGIWNPNNSWDKATQRKDCD
jgi:endonuclease YncB( thermonuclease family)